MEILDKSALAALTDDEILNIFIRMFSIAPDKIIATRDQLIDAILKIRKAA